MEKKQITQAQAVEIATEQRNCNKCKMGRFGRCDKLKANEEYQVIWERAENEKGYLGMMDSEKFKSNYLCEEFKSIYIEYPITVNIIKHDANRSTYRDSEIGKFVAIRPCGDEYGKKTYLGLYLGDLPLGIRIRHNSETLELTASFDSNPAIFVLDFNKIVYGCESWWGIIENEQDLEQITNADVDNVWYVKALKRMQEGAE